MSTSWIGSTISIDCGPILGTYQGQVSAVAGDKQTISIIKGCRNGIPSAVPEITIRGSDIKDLKILQTCEELEATKAREPRRSGNSGSSSATLTIPPRKNQHNGSSDSGGGSYNPKDETFRKRTYSGSEYRQSQKNVTPKKNDRRQNNRTPREDTFSAPVDGFMEEFDFEKNLALFDKQAVFEEIENSQKPDVVRTAQSQTQRPAKYRHDENVIPSGPVCYRQIDVKSEFRGPREYVTDLGLVVPSITKMLKSKIFTSAERFGFTAQRLTETIGRSAAEMALQLSGGKNRLNPKNDHQRPRVVVLAGSHAQGAQGINCARHLSNHSVEVVVFLPTDGPILHCVLEELHLFEMTRGKKVGKVQDLPSHPQEIIINALDQEESEETRRQPWYPSLVDWCNQSKANVLAIDPPESGSSIDTKWSLSPALPLNLAQNCGNIYLCDVGFPKKIFEDNGVKYNSPYGGKFIIPLHLNK
ncbi:enhancer of mRNA-decapping protein 3-like [Lineus longissimus]|uniref:enhancer of mRNA-decapping protein 3-like n=1 Tax=Lineus longissimus TaxID=88925 RepID=UPI002B4DC6FF